MALSSVISLGEMKSLVLTKRETHQEISNILKERYPDMRGLSAMNVRRFCNENRIKTRTTLNDSEIQKEVTKSIAEVINEFLQKIVRKNAVLFLKVFVNLSFIPHKQIPDKNFTSYLLSLSYVKVGGNYGRKMMMDRLRSMGVSISERKVGNALKKVCPSTQAERCMQAGRSFNPKVYKADYFGHKLHVDQNEKLVMYGVTHVVAQDGYSGMIAGYTTMAVKNNLTIYEKMFW